MPQSVPVATAYDLPFTVTLPPPPLLSTGQTVRLQVLPAAPRTEEVIEDYESVVTPFAVLAETGALAGASPSPAFARAFEWFGPEWVGAGLEWQFEGCVFDDRAAVVLAQLFLLSHKAHPVRAVTLTAPGRATAPLPYDSRVNDPYPPIWRPAPFPVFIDPDLYDAVTLRVKFVRTMTADEGRTIDSLIMTWAAVTSLGAYGAAPIPPEECTALFPEKVILIDDELELPITKMRAHRSCLHGLVNVCIALHQTVLPILDLSIE
jgi:hypothetical protein